MRFKDFSDLVSQINTDLGPFCNHFQYTRKALTNAGKVAERGRLFGNIHDDRDDGWGWAINLGSTNEIQYHIFFNYKNELGYGIGFNTQYVPFRGFVLKDVLPYMQAFLELESTLHSEIPYKFVQGDRKKLENPKDGEFSLWGNSLEVIKVNEGYEIEDIIYKKLLEDLQKGQFEAYKKIFEKRNFLIGIERLHEEIYVWLKENQPNSYYLLRDNDAHGRLKQGYWFWGNNDYLILSFWQGKDRNNDTYIIGFYLQKDGTCTLKFSATDSEVKARILRGISRGLPNMKTLKEEGKEIAMWEKKYQDKDYIANITHFIENEKPIIDSILEIAQPEIFAEFMPIQKEDFEVNKKKIEELRFKPLIKYTKTSDLAKLLKDDFNNLYPMTENAGSELMRLFGNNFHAKDLEILKKSLEVSINFKDINISRNPFEDAIKSLPSVSKLPELKFPNDFANQISLLNKQLSEIAKSSQSELQNLLNKWSELNSKTLNDLKSIGVIKDNIIPYYEPHLLLRKLSIENIGIFSKLELLFSKKVTILIGENGTGKTTLLRAIALALAGISENSLMDSRHPKIVNMLRIQNESYEDISYCEKGAIRLEYDNKNYYDGDESCQNTILFSSGVYGVKVEDDSSSDFTSIKNDKFPHLVMGFSQLQNSDSPSAIKNIPYNELSKIKEPHVKDLVSLIYNQGGGYFESFSDWIIKLYNRGKQDLENIPSLKEAPQHKLIHHIFAIISDIIGTKISFKKIKSSDKDSDIIWIQDSNQQDIPLHLVSQGFNSIFSWVGYFTMRMFDSVPSLDDDVTTFESKEGGLIAYSGAKFEHKFLAPATCFIDEIDTYLHPKWQRTILATLVKHFPNTQFIVTTHSPFVLTYLPNENDSVLIYKIMQNGEVTPLQAAGRDIRSFLLEWFEISERPAFAQKEIDDLYQAFEVESPNFTELRETIKRLRQKYTDNDPDLLKAEHILNVLED